MKSHPVYIAFLTFALCTNQFVNCEDGADAVGAVAAAGSAPDHGSDDLSRYARASPLRWGKRGGGQVLRWGKREDGLAGDDGELDDVRREEVLQSRHVREAPLRWGKRSFGDDKRAPLRWGKRTPSRFGKRQDFSEDDYELGPYFY